MKTILLICAFLISVHFTTTASHAVGADVQYEWITGLNYKVTFSFYRDCAGIGAPSTVSICYQSVSCNLNGTANFTYTSPPVITSLCPQLNTICSGGTYPGIE